MTFSSKEGNICVIIHSKDFWIILEWKRIDVLFHFLYAFMNGNNVGTTLGEGETRLFDNFLVLEDVEETHE